MDYILNMKGICKSFPGVRALHEVDLQVKAGEVLSLMGENGAGKSTLIKVLTGVYQHDSGEIMFDGKKIKPKSTLAAQKVGISTIYQELNLVLQQTIYENVFLGREICKAGKRLDQKAMIEQAEKILSDMGIDVDVTRQLSQCSTAIQQMVAIARAISVHAKLVIMDEPTSSLDTSEVKVLFNVIRKLKEENIAVIFISHRLDEVFEISDRVTVLRGGEKVGDADIKDMDKLKLVSLMIGSEKKAALANVNNKPAIREDVLSAAQNVHWKSRLDGMDLEIRKGEVVGLAGLLGAGRTEMAKMIFGSTSPDEGVFYFDGKAISRFRPRHMIQRGMGFCTEDRKIEGIFPHMSVAENLTIALMPKISKFGIINQKKRSEVVQEYIKALSVKTPSEHQQIKFLSGGNQQKVLLARWMCMNPRLVIMDEPTRGIDVGAKAEIEDLIQNLASRGISILMISSELEEIVRNCNRVAVMRDGKKMGELESGEITTANILELMAKEHGALTKG